MKKFNIVFIALFLLSRMVFGQTNWSFDTYHSNVQFNLAYMVVSDVTGKFEKFNGSVSSNGDDFENAKISFTIDASTINTDNKGRDEHLRGADFFDVKKFPNITFNSRSFKKVSDKNFKLEGDLTMKDKTLPVVLDVVFNGTIVDKKGQTRAGFKLTGDVKRSNWGINYGIGDIVIGETVTITANVNLIKK